MGSKMFDLSIYGCIMPQKTCLIKHCPDLKKSYVLCDMTSDYIKLYKCHTHLEANYKMHKMIRAEQKKTDNDVVMYLRRNNGSKTK